MIRMRPRFGRVKKKDPAELVRFRLKMVQLFSDTIALLKDEGDHELAEELRKTKNYTAHNPAQSRGRARRVAARPEKAEEAVTDRIQIIKHASRPSRCGRGCARNLGSVRKALGDLGLPLLRPNAKLSSHLLGRASTERREP